MCIDIEWQNGRHSKLHWCRDLKRGNCKLPSGVIRNCHIIMVVYGVVEINETTHAVLYGAVFKFCGEHKTDGNFWNTWS